MNNSVQTESKQLQKAGSLDLGFLKIPRTVVKIIEKLIILIVLTLAVYFLLPRLSSIEKSVEILRSMKRWAVFLAIGIQVLRNLANGLIISECTKIARSKVNTITSTLIYMASYSFGLVAGGMFGTAATTFRWVKANNGNDEGASLAVSIPPLFIDVALAAAAIVGIVFLFINDSLTTFEIIAYTLIMLLLAAVGIVSLLAVKNKDRFIDIITKILSAVLKIFKRELPADKVSEFLRSLLSTLDFLMKEGWKGPMGASFLSVFLDMATIYVLFIAGGSSIPLLSLVTGYGLPVLFGRMAFIFPGGIGIIESTMVASYTGLGIDNSLATVIVLAFRVLSFWMPAIAGFLLIPYLNKLSDSKS
jgi:hypothetical protein